MDIAGRTGRSSTFPARSAETFGERGRAASTARSCWPGRPVAAHAAAPAGTFAATPRADTAGWLHGIRAGCAAPGRPVEPARPALFRDESVAGPRRLCRTRLRISGPGSRWPRSR